MTSIDDQFKIADSHNNAAGLEPLHEVSPPLFDEYIHNGSILTEWNDSESLERDANGHLVKIGRPFVKLIFHVITPQELVVLKSYETEVTVRLYNKTTNAWGNYNATWEVPHDEREWGQDQWDEVVAYARHLQAV